MYLCLPQMHPDPLQFQKNISRYTDPATAGARATIICWLAVESLFLYSCVLTPVLSLDTPQTSCSGLCTMHRVPVYTPLSRYTDLFSPGKRDIDPHLVFLRVISAFPSCSPQPRPSHFVKTPSRFPVLAPMFRVQPPLSETVSLFASGTELPSHKLTWKCKKFLSKRKVVFLQGSAHFHVSWCEGTKMLITESKAIPLEYWLRLLRGLFLTRKYRGKRRGGTNRPT